MAKEVRQGVVLDTDGGRVMVLWLKFAAEAPVELVIGGAKGDG